ncbi:MAG: hypothetical protein NZ992_00070 [Candidatus Korarchaeum sp.]|nr:hypothetical protein [Candidatus Korarchaeum sp.]MDW8093362.1 hypothetical protein [Nitrososphaerota archaeon]
MRRSVILLLPFLLIPIFGAQAPPFIIEPRSVTVRGFVGLPIEVPIQVNSLGNEISLNFTCSNDLVTPPPNNTVVSPTSQTVVFRVDASKSYKAFTTCYVLASDFWGTVTFDIMVDRLFGGLTLSTDRVQVNQEINTRVTYPNRIYLSNNYNFSTVRFSVRGAPSWFSLGDITLLPKTTQPVSFTIDTKDMLVGLYYSTVYYSYYVNNTVAGSGSFGVTLNVTPKTGAVLGNYLLTIQVVEDVNYTPIPNAAVFISSTTDSMILFTDDKGVVSNVLRGGAYSVKIKAAGYMTYETTITLDRNLTRIIMLKKGEETTTTPTTTTTTTTTPTPNQTEATLRIPYYNVTLQVPRGGSNSASIPLIAVGGTVSVQVTDVVAQPNWITASLSSPQLMEGSTGFLVITAAPPNITSLGNYSKQFYLAYNNKIALITAKVQVLPEKVENITIPRYNYSYQRPSYLRVPVVSVVLRGVEGLSTTAPAKCALNDIVYVVVQGDYNLVRVKPTGLALLGVEPRTDGLVYRYQVKENNAAMDILLVYTNPVTGLESTERPEEYGFGTYRFEVVENPEVQLQKQAVLMVTIGDGSSVSDTSQTLVCTAYIYYPNGTKRAYEGEITFQPSYRFSNSTLTPAVVFSGGFGTVNFKYAGTYVPQKPNWWNGDFRVNPMQIEVRPTITDWRDMRQWTTDEEIVYDLSDFGMDIYYISVVPEAQWNLEGMVLKLKGEEGRSYVITVEGFLYKNFQNVMANRDVTLRIMTSKVTSGVRAMMWNTLIPIIAGLAAFFIIRFIYFNLASRRTRRPWEG